MQIINVDGTEYKVPESWYEINLKQFITFMDMLNGTDSNPNYTVLYQIAAFCIIDLDKVKRMNPRYLKVFLDSLEFLQQEPTIEPVYEFNHNGEKYTVINHLLNAQTQDFISLMAIEKDNEKHPYRGLPQKIAILAKKEGETLDNYDIIERSNQFLSLPVTIAKSLDSFFLLAQTIFSKDFHISVLKSQNELIQQLLKSQIDSLKKPVGTRWFGKWQGKMFAKYLKLIAKHWNKYYSSIISKV